MNFDDASQPLLYRWDDLVLSFSPTAKLAPHYHGAAELVVSLGNPVTCLLPHGQSVSANSLLIPPGVTHQNCYTDRISATLYFDLDSAYYHQLKHRMAAHGSVFRSIPLEKELQKQLASIYRQTPTLDQCLNRIRHLLEPGVTFPKRRLDPRVRRVVSLIRENPAIDSSVDDFACQVKLSADRLHHLFTKEVGVPLHKFRLWLRLKRVSELFFAGYSLTYAAHQTGFADSAHFSRTFKRMYGSAPRLTLSMRHKSRLHYS